MISIKPSLADLVFIKPRLASLLTVIPTHLTPSQAAHTFLSTKWQLEILIYFFEIILGTLLLRTLYLNSWNKWVSLSKKRFLSFPLYLFCLMFLLLWCCNANWLLFCHQTIKVDSFVKVVITVNLLSSFVTLSRWTEGTSCPLTFSILWGWSTFYSSLDLIHSHSFITGPIGPLNFCLLNY